MNPINPIPADTFCKSGVSSAFPAFPGTLCLNRRTVKVIKNATSRASATEMNTGVDGLGADNKFAGVFFGSEERSIDHSWTNR